LRLFFPAILVGLVAPCIWPFLHPVSLLPFSFIAERTAAEHFPFLYRPENTVVVILLEQMAGIVAGGCVGWLLARLLKSGKAGGHRIGAGRVKELVDAQRIWSFSLALVGLFLGWQVVVPAAVSLLAIEGVLRILGRKGLFILELCGVVFLLVVGRDLLWVEHFF
jgi:membrane protein YqaA with SNARE-associated domain